MRADHFRMRLTERIADPTRRLKSRERRKSLGGGDGGALAPVFRCGRAIPSRAVNHRQRLDPAGIDARKGLRNAATHRATGNRYARPFHVVEQAREIARK